MRDPTNELATLSPLAHEPGDSVGVCLDLDGTVYRPGSVLVETLAYLPYADAIDIDDADRNHLREALLAVAEYGGGRESRRRYERVLRFVEGVRRLTTPGIARLLVDAIRGFHLGVAPRLPGSDGPRRDRARVADDVPDYETMQAGVLSAYGSFLADRAVADVDRAVESVVDRHLRTDAPLVETVATLQRGGVDLVLVTDAPHHVASAYADVIGADDVRATTYETTEGRYTGAYDTIDKETAAGQCRRDHGWDYVVAGGDSDPDLAMARAANCFLAVDGAGDMNCSLEGIETVLPVDSPGEMRRRLETSGVVRVDRETDLIRALETVLRAVGVV